MKVIYGNLLDLAEKGQFDIILHGANCWNTMKSGIAGEIARRYPEVVAADNLTKKGDPSKLGSLSVAGVFRPEFQFAVVNLYTQFFYGRDKNTLYVNYDAVRNSLIALRDRLEYCGSDQARIGYPKIGCGLANGDWQIVGEIFREELKEYDHSLVIMEG